MASIGKYKAAAATSSKYTRGLGKVQETQYDRAWNEQQGEQQRAMYGAIGSTVQNIVGIMDEKKKLSEMGKLKDVAAGLEGIETREEQYQPLGSVGDILGLKTKTRKSYFSKESGTELTESVMQAIGMKKAYTGKSDYDVAPEGWLKPGSPQDKIKKARESIEPGQMPYNVETKKIMDTAAAGEQYEFYEEGVTEEAADSEGLLDKVGKKVGDTTVYDEETRTATTTVDDDSAYVTTGIEPDAVERGDIIEESIPGMTDEERSSMNEARSSRQFEEFTKGSKFETPGGKYDPVTEQSSKASKRESEQQNRDIKRANRIEKTGEAIDVTEAIQASEDTIMDTMKEKERVAGLQGADAAKHSISTAFQDVPGLSGRTKEATMAIGMESSYGQDKSAGGNVFQIKNEGIRGMAQAENVDLSDPAQAGKFYIKTVDKLTEDFGDYTVQTGSLKDTKFDVFKAFDAHGLDKEAVKYISWQQGRMGAVDMITAMQTGKIGDETKKNMLNNLSESQHDDLWKILQGSSGSKEDRNKEFIQKWLFIQKSKMESHGYSHHKESDVYG